MNGSDISYIMGNVGIVATTPGTWKLAVNGKVRVKEVKAGTANWSGYVFTKSNDLRF